MVLPIMRADYRLVETYRPSLSADLTIPVSCCYGREDPDMSCVEAEAWREVTTGEFELQSFPGGHFYLRNESEAALVAWLGTRVHERNH